MSVHFEQIDFFHNNFSNKVEFFFQIVEACSLTFSDFVQEFTGFDLAGNLAQIDRAKI